MIERSRGTAAEFHERELPDDGQVHAWWFEVQAPALVLGSAQRDDVVDRAACERVGVEVVRRRSGGGAVLLVPGLVVWLDLVLPADHPRWDADVGRAAWWVGDLWVDVLGRLGVPDAAAHRGPLQSSPWSRLVCHAGLGPGEVTAQGVKLVGISQRRTRHAARFQCSLQLRDVTDALVALLSPDALDGLDPHDLAGIGSLEAMRVEASPSDVLDALATALPAHLA